MQCVFGASQIRFFIICRTVLLCLTLKQPGGLLACAQYQSCELTKTRQLLSAIANASSALSALQHLGAATGTRSRAASYHVSPQPVHSNCAAYRYTASILPAQIPQVRQEMLVFGMWSLLVTAACMPALSFGTSRHDVLNANASSRLLLADAQSGANHVFGSSR